MQQRLTILGSTGSIGINTLDVVAQHPGRFKVIALTAHTKIDALLDQCKRFRPAYAVVTDMGASRVFTQRATEAGLTVQVLSGVEGLEHVASLPEVDTVMAAIVGIAGLRPTIAAAIAGKKILLANKESLVTAGAVFMNAVRDGRAQLLPIDSEHNAVFQALPDRFDGDLDACGVRRILLTASGGPFRNTPVKQLANVTPEQACAHPNWVMGRKISVDSATMMNKGLEVIEAHWLFRAPARRIEVVVHPQSIVHSMVEYIDGSVIAQLGNPDMRTPIAHALVYPERISNGVNFLDLTVSGGLSFEKPDLGRFPCLALAYEALRSGQGAATIINAANEVAVARFLGNSLEFMEIPKLIESILATMPQTAANSLNEVLAIDREARERAQGWSPGIGYRARTGTMAVSGPG
jgi:1-deoxy-D-xylulose-5-phosphate reductoisomerase